MFSYDDFLVMAKKWDDNYGCILADADNPEDAHIDVCPECGEPVYFVDICGGVERACCPACEFDGADDE